MKSIKCSLVAMLFSVATFAEAPHANRPAACGPDDASFSVKLDSTQHTLVLPEPGKARIYFVQETFGIISPVLTRIGVDGLSAGANQDNSYFSLSVEPGEHHFCADTPYKFSHGMELAGITAEAGKSYYFRVRTIYRKVGLFLSLETLDSDEAKYLIGSFPLSVSQLKK